MTARWRYGRRLHAGLNGAVERALTLSLPVQEPTGRDPAAENPSWPTPLAILASPAPLILAALWAAAAAACPPPALEMNATPEARP